MTNVINLKHSLMSRINREGNQLQVESTENRINSRLNQPQVAKVKEGKTHQVAGLSRFTRLKSGDPVVFHALPGESADPRQGGQARPGARVSCSRAYIRAWELELELELKLELELELELYLIYNQAENLTQI